MPKLKPPQDETPLFLITRIKVNFIKRIIGTLNFLRIFATISSTT